MTHSIAVLGAGSWGATLASQLARKGRKVSLWEFDPRQARVLNKSRRLKVLPTLKIPKQVFISSDMTAVLAGRKIVICATPSHVTRATLKTAWATGEIGPGVLFVSATKGLEEGTLKRMSQIAEEELPQIRRSLAVLSGPSHAEEVALKVPTAVVAASAHEAVARAVQALFMAPEFRVYTQKDVVGAELGGALKNVIAIGCGIIDGLELGDNTKATLMTRGLTEIARLGARLGGEIMTFFGLTGLGDLIVTCDSRHSRNRLLGEKLGEGKSLHRALREMTMVAEGVKTAKAAKALARKAGVETPILAQIHAILHEGKSAKAALKTLLQRPMRSETQWLNFGRKVL